MRTPPGREGGRGLLRALAEERAAEVTRLAVETARSLGWGDAGLEADGQLAGIRLEAGGRPASGRRGLGWPAELDGEVWVGIAGAAAVTGAGPRTITGWLSRGGPTHCPFPAAHRFLYRLYWPLAEIESWAAANTGASA